MKQLFLSITLLSCTCLFSQGKGNSLKFQVGFELPTGDFLSAYKTGFGIFITDYFSVSEKGSLVFSVGTSSWKAKDADIRGNLSQIKAGYRQFVISGLYLQADGGWGRYTGTWGGGNRFVYSGGVGYLVKTKGSNGIDLNVRFSRVPNRSWLGLAVGYQFKL